MVDIFDAPLFVVVVVVLVVVVVVVVVDSVVIMAYTNLFSFHYRSMVGQLKGMTTGVNGLLNGNYALCTINALLMHHLCT